MIELRFATSSDAPLILRFVHALAEYERQPDAVQLTEAILHQQLADAAPPFECVIAELDGAQVGFALFFHTYSTWLGKRGMWLEDLFVLPEARRHGVGGALLRRLAAIAVERDCGRFEWSVLDWNAPARDFYATLGAKLMEEWLICRLEGPALAAIGAADLERAASS
jgi:GNAT superfamily N-acetyltransferase